MRMLLVEDDAVLGEAMRDHVAAAGHAVDWARTLAATRDHLEVAPYQLMLLDLNLPDGRGLDLLVELRRGGSDLPVIVVTARDQIAERIAGLNAGADDYMVKPFALDELSARLAAVARRYAGKPSPFVRIAGLDIDLAGRRLARDGDDVVLTPREWAVLDQLAARPGTIVTKSQIEDALYAFGFEVESNTVEVYVSRLRKKLGPGIVETARGLGYRMAAG